ncbi:COQ9 family protein [Roseospira goensis]|uniref:Ubiquinone biosynthesis protein COQ9 n=1 Tax=Roseospira goensis TaxID=391922 RepID=A0A7W6WKA7_9PROT|nr:COQ9 family protein [Roseospira goensis]MBB4285569.1 ubiquinone biosynthesis protein COQ9 [Roseospira goensis]
MTDTPEEHPETDGPHGKTPEAAPPDPDAGPEAPPHAGGHDTMTAVRDAIVENALIHVAFDGWSKRTLRAAAVDAGFEASQADRAFPGGSVDAVAHWCELADRRMEQALAEADTEGLRLHERVGLAIRLRLHQWEMDREAVRRAVAVLSLPTNTATALRCTYRTVDTIWWAVGDSSTDFNFYTKRVQLAGVYSATLLYWLDDSSEDSAETWGFLDRRLNDIVRLHKMRGRVERRLSKVPNPFGAARAVGDSLRGMARKSPFRARRHRSA